MRFELSTRYCAMLACVAIACSVFDNIDVNAGAPDASTGGTGGTAGTSGTAGVSGTSGTAGSAGALPVDLEPRTSALGWEHACTIVASSEVWCWGDNSQGALGRGTVNDPDAGPSSKQYPRP